MAGTPHPDAEDFPALLQRWCDGEDAAADEIMRRTVPWIRNVVRKDMGADLRRKDESLDIVQEAMCEYLAYGQRFSVQSEENFRALLARIVSNVLCDRHAFYTRRRRDMHRERSRAGHGSSVCIEPVGAMTDPADRAETNESTELVRIALELLPPTDRDVIVRRQFDGEPIVAIARSLGENPDAVRKRYARALTKLSDCVRHLETGDVAAALAD